MTKGSLKGTIELTTASTEPYFSRSGSFRHLACSPEPEPSPIIDLVSPCVSLEVLRSQKGAVRGEPVLVVERGQKTAVLMCDNNCILPSFEVH